MKIDEYKKSKNLTNADFGWLWLESFSFLNATKKNKIRKLVGSGDEIYNIEKYQDKIVEICGDNNFFKMINSKNNLYMETFFEKIYPFTDFISIDHPDYPSKLKDIDCPPTVLYYKGDLSLLKTSCIALLGTRLFDTYGFAVTQKFVKTFVNAKVTVVGGLNEGLDTVMHKMVLEEGGKTIAVISGGINKIYPAINTDLCKKIAQEGLVISEWQPSADSLRYMFPIRGRIISGICDAIVITEAGMKSGLRYTIDYALEQNRNLYVVPGNITSYKSSLNNSLIKSCQSMLVTHPDEVLDDLKIVYEPYKESVEPTYEESLIYAVLDNVEDAHFDFILHKTGLPQKRLMGILTGLEIRGKVKRLPGNKYIRMK